MTTAIDPQTRATLIQRFAPFVWIHSEEPSRPSSVNWTLTKAQLLDSNNKVVKDQPLTPTDLQEYASSNAASQYSLYYPNQNNMEALWPPDPTFVLRGQPYTSSSPIECTAQCYAHLRELTTSLAGYAITYMFFNPFNASTALNGHVPIVGVHVGDWEHITVLVSQDTERVVAVYFAQHGTGSWLSPDSCTFQSDEFGNATHVVVYSARASHASYPTSGSYMNPDWYFIAMDYTDQGTPWKTWKTVVDIGEQDKPTPGYEWITYTGRWGTNRGTKGEGTSPQTPTFQSWYKVEQGEADFNSIPQSGLVVFHQGYGDSGQMQFTAFDTDAWMIDTLVPDSGMSVSPAPIVYNNLLYCFHQDYGKHGNLVYDLFDYSNKTFKVNQSVSSKSMAESPAVIVYNNQLYCFYQGYGANGTLHYNVFNGSTWSGDTIVPHSGMSISPAVIVYNNQLYCFYQNYGANGALHYNVFNGSTWSGDQLVATKCMSASPAVVVYNNRLYCFYQGYGAKGTLHYNVFDGSTWSGDTVVANCGLSESPAVAVYNDQLYCLYQGPGKSGELHYNIFNGSAWRGDATIAAVGMSSAPGVVVVQFQK